MATAQNIMTLAEKYIGTKENPANSNNVIFNTHYYGQAVYDGLWGQAFPWCCAFVWDIFRLAGASNLFYDGKKTATCATYETWARNKGLSVGKGNGQYGDVVTFDFNNKGRAHHIGFIKKKNPDGTYQTIEGNTSASSNDNGGIVMERTRSQSQIRYIFRPKYDAGKATEGVYMFIVKNVKNGSVGNDVLLVQEILRARGYKGQDGQLIGLDKSCGPNTVYAIKKFQADNGLAADGEWGPATWAKALAL